MKLLFRHITTTLLRTALLLGALTFCEIETEGRNTLPDAFETMDPATIIGDGQYYYIQFYEGSIHSFLSDKRGEGNRLRSADFLPFSRNIQWTLEATGTTGQFLLKSKNDLYVYADALDSYVFRLTYAKSNATPLKYYLRGDGGYEISRAADENNRMYRHGNDVWADIDSYQKNNAHNCLRIAKLKDDVAYIIYRQDPIYKDNAVIDRNTDTRGGSAGFTQHHYLTYSGTDSGDDHIVTDISSRASILTTYDNWAMSTAAAYHQDGLWTLEKAEVDGVFYIKKYGATQYLNEVEHEGIYVSELQAKDASKGIYTLEDASVNRYTRVQNVKYEEDDLTSDMFFEWDGYGANANKISTTDVNVYFGNDTQLSGDGTVYGYSWTVDYLKYADLTGYKKMTITGTPDMQLRVLMDRVEPVAGGDPYGGAFVEKAITIGGDGKAVVDLTDMTSRYAQATVKMTYINGSDGTTYQGDNGQYTIPNEVNTSYGEIPKGSTARAGYNIISGGYVKLANKAWDKNYITYLQVDASAISGSIRKVTLKAQVSGSSDSKRTTNWGVGYNSSVWSPDMTYNTADKSITKIGTEVWTTTKDANTFEFKEFDITDAFSSDDDNIVTILVYELQADGGYIKNPEVVVEYVPNDIELNVNYAHLNSIKVAGNSPGGTISSIKLEKVSDQNVRYLNYTQGDGWQVLQKASDDNDWYAGFYPVEVVETDEFYQVILKQGDQMVGVDSDQKAVMKTYDDFRPDVWYLEMDDYQNYWFKDDDGEYYQGLGNSLSNNRPTGVGVYKNEDINIPSSYVTVQWVPKTETRILHDVTHKVSNLRLFYDPQYTDRAKITPEMQELYSQQGLVTDADSEWWDSKKGTQKVNEFKITHFVKKGDMVTYGLPTVLTENNDHRLFQRWYKYKDDTNLADLKDHFRLKVNNIEVMSYLYNNGIVTGERLDWGAIFPGARTYELNYLTYRNSDGKEFTLAADVSRYSDFTYKNGTDHLDGNLEEPSLTMRYIYYMKDAKHMADSLMACTEGSNKWLEEKTIHFPEKRLAYEGNKANSSGAYQGEFLGIYHTFRDYWVYSETPSTNATDDWKDVHLVSAADDGGKLEIVVESTEDNSSYDTGITKGGKDDKGYYLYDEGKSTDTSYGDSRFVAFKYPGESVNATGEDHPAYIKVYFKLDENTRYQIAKFTLIFDKGTSTLPWTSVNGSEYVKDVENANNPNGYRDPNNLEARAGKPIAKITFDYPTDVTFKNSSGYNIHNIGVMEGWWGEIPNSSPLPLTFDNTNYGFDGDNPSWGSYALVTTTPTRYGYNMTALPANDATYGYNIGPDDGLQSAFLYIDASEQPGDICSVDFVGEFCAGDRLMCSGWISGTNKMSGDNRCPGSVTITVKGERTENGEKVQNDIYRFCPGQCYELDNGTGTDGSTGATHVVWQQFYFEFSIDRKYERQWVEVNNNCVSSTGGDFMLDNIEVYAMVPEVEPEMNSPICVYNDYSEMQLLKLDVGFDKLIVASGVNTQTEEGEHDFGLVFLNKKKFLETLRNALITYNGITLSLEQVEQNVENGIYQDITNTYKNAYEAAFDAALLGRPEIWDSRNPNANQGAGILNFRWNHKFEKNELFSFTKAVERLKPIFRYTDPETHERFLVMNGNYPVLNWELNTDYYIIYYNEGITDASLRFQDFNICSDCNKEKVFQLEPPFKILSMDSSDETQELEVCEGKIPTVLTDLTAYNIDGVQVTLKDLNFDWWLGDPQNGVIATLENYHNQYNSYGERLDVALSTLRAYYPDATSLAGIRQHLAVSPNPSLTLTMIDYLQALVDAGQLVLHQKSVNVPAQRTSADDPYCYIVACPIHDASFDQSLNAENNKYVAYYCDEPQGLRMKVGEKAPSLKCGFVPNENGFESYDYSAAGNAVLSVRLAKRAQFETVQHGTTTDAPVTHSSAPASDHFLWLPIRNAQVQTTTSTGVIQKSNDYNVYLASTDDPVWDKAIYQEMKKATPVGSLPIVGKIVQLNAINTKGVDANGNEIVINADDQNDANRLCIYFTENFEVREGYSYTLSLPFKENGENVNTCDGTLLLNLKIVPDYEVWTGGAGSTDWNNDDNWRRADGNLGTATEESKNGAGRNNNELYISADINSEESTSKLKNYVTNYTNYRTAKDRLLRKGFAPLYCTHILMKSDEWGDDPQLYDALNGKSSLDAAPFPNLSESYEATTMEYVDERFTDLSTLANSNQSFALFDENSRRLLYGTYEQNLAFGNYDDGVKATNSGYYFKLESVTGGYLFRLQTPGGGPYTIWGKPGYLNSQLLNLSVSFILGLDGWNSDNYTYGQDGDYLALWTLESDGHGRFALKNVGTGKYLKDNSNARYDTPTYFTFCTLKKEEVTSQQTKDNILKYDMQARLYDIWSDTYGTTPNKGRTGDLLAEMYQINSCDEIAFQPTAELLNAHLLNYNNAWVEHELTNNRWYLLGSSLQGAISGEWYAPTGTAQQKTTYYEPVQFGTGYDRYSPAIYQRSWDKAKAVLYEVGANYNTSDDDQDANLGTPLQGQWSGTTWDVTNADTYLDRLGYKPMGDKKANVAMKGIWSNTYNDATVDYSKGAFSVMVMNGLKNNDQSSGKAIIRLPKEDTMYDYYKYEETGAADGGTDTELTDVQTALSRAKNRGRLKTDLLLPLVDNSVENETYKQIQRTETAVSRYGDQRTYTRVPTQVGTNALPMTLQTIEETVSAGISNMGYYLVENPFQTGLDMNEFFSENTGLQKKYWLLTPTGQQLVQQAADGTWISPNGSSFTDTEAKVAPGQGFFVQATTAGEATTITFNADMQAQTRYGVKDAGTEFTVVVGTKQKMTTETVTITLDDGTTETKTVEVPETDESGNYKVEDITDKITIYSYVQDTDNDKVFPLKARTRADGSSEPGMVITAQRGDTESSALVMMGGNASNDFLPEEDTEVFINSDLEQVPTVYTLCGRLATTINSIRDFRCLPIGVTSASDAPCVLTFRGVETLGDSVALYDAVERQLTPLEPDMQIAVSGQTQNRYYLVRSLNIEEAAAETHLQIFTEHLTAKVIASTAEPIVSVRCVDTAGRLVHNASPLAPDYSFTLPGAGIYIIEAQTGSDRKTKKVMAK